MQFTIEFKPQGRDWVATIIGVDAALVRTIGAGDRGFPHPPPSERGEWAASWQSLCSDMSDGAHGLIQQRIVSGEFDPARNEVTDFGGYLWAVMLGPWWAAVIAAAPIGPVELQLSLPADDLMLQGLPWELMMVGGRPLAALPDPRRRVAITRLVRPVVPPHQQPIEMPLRVLFAVGAQMDEALRPGTEYLSLLRQFKMADNLGVALHTRILLMAGRKSLQDAIETFNPSIVHFVAHGRLTDDVPELLLTVDDDQRFPWDPVPADILAAILRDAGGRPSKVQAVVLNACHTGEPNRSYRSYGATLVQQGIPMVIGMSGEVADGACRVFTSAFYQGLVRSENLDQACADGRRAAILHYKASYTQSVEWSRPTLFRAEGVTAMFEVDEARSNFARAASRFRERDAADVLCGRMEALQAFQHFGRAKASNGPAALAYEVGLPRGATITMGRQEFVSQLGKSMLLEELTCQAVLEGLVPCALIMKNSTEVPPNLLGLAIRLGEEMDVTRDKFDVERRPRSNAYDVAFDALGIEKVPTGATELTWSKAVEQVKARLCKLPPAGRREWASSATVLAAIRADLDRLLEDVGAPAESRAIVLIDNLHSFVGIALPLLQAVGSYGLGNKERPVPLVVSYSTKFDAGPQILNEGLKGREKVIQRMELLPFTSPHETLQAYRQYWLARRWAPSSISSKRVELNNMLANLHTSIQGVPTMLSFLDGPLLLPVFTSGGLLVRADDDVIMKELRDHDAS